MSIDPPGGGPPIRPTGPPPGPAERPREKRAEAAASPASAPPGPMPSGPMPSGPPAPTASSARPAGVAQARSRQVLIFVVALAVALGGGIFLGRGTAEAGEVLLEAAPSVGPDPFMPPPEKPGGPTADPTADPSAGATDEPTVEPTDDPRTPPPPPPTITVTVGGRQVGLYGGTGSDRVCDVEQMIEFLTGDPAKAAAWARVQGIPVAQVPGYLRSLTPTFLQVDTRVTNHGFRGGVATPRQSVLQAGTAVLVDDKGVPRARCKCGNPLLPPAPVQGKTTYVGARWPDFNPGTLASVGRLASAPPTASPAPTTTRRPAGGVPLNVSGSYVVTDSSVSPGCGDEVTISDDSFSVRHEGSSIVFSDEDGDSIAIPLQPDGSFSVNEEGASFSGRFTTTGMSFRFTSEDCVFEITARKH